MIVSGAKPMKLRQNWAHCLCSKVHVHTSAHAQRFWMRQLSGGEEPIAVAHDSHSTPKPLNGLAAKCDRLVEHRQNVEGCSPSKNERHKDFHCCRCTPKPLNGLATKREREC
eukprot:1141776-Pelagomonas_calceolata.AAC.3